MHKKLLSLDIGPRRNTIKGSDITPLRHPVIGSLQFIKWVTNLAFAIKAKTDNSLEDSGSNTTGFSSTNTTTQSVFDGLQMFNGTLLAVTNFMKLRHKCSTLLLAL